MENNGYMDAPPPPAPISETISLPLKDTVEDLPYISETLQEEASIPDDIVETSLQMPEPVAPQKEPVQISMNLPDDDLLAAFQRSGFICIDNRKKSGILWVIYDSTRANRFAEISRRYNLTSALERRGAIATNGAPAWRVKTSK